MTTQNTNFLSCDIEDPLRTMYRYKAANDFGTAVFIQNHLYGIDCKMSGAINLLSEVKGSLTLIHGVRTCGFQHSFTRSDRMEATVGPLCTDMGENEVIYGGHDVLCSKIGDAYRRHRPKLIAMLSSCLSGITGEYLQEAVDEMKSKLPCSIIHVNTDGFMHRGQESVDDDEEKNIDCLSNCRKRMDENGCGRIEAAAALVDQLMEARDVEENTANLEYFGGRIFGLDLEFNEIRRFLGRIGVTVKSTFPAGDVEHIRNAPSAALNVAPVAYGRWLGRMEERFGTPHVKKQDMTSGLDSIERFYREIAARFGRQGEADIILKTDRLEAERQMECCRRVFRGNRFAIHSSTLSIIPHLAGVYVHDLQLPVDCIYLDTRRLSARNVSPSTYERKIDTVIGILRGLGLKCEIIIGRDGGGTNDAHRNEDYVLSDMPWPPFSPGEAARTIDISPLNYLLNKMSFASVVISGRYLAGYIGGTGRAYQGKLIMSRLAYDPLNSIMLKEPVCGISKGLWAANGIDSRY